LIPKKARIPAPFQRPSIELSHHGKTWQEVPARLIQSGDIIAGFGKVGAIYENLADDTLVQIFCENAVAQEVVCFDPEDVVRVFGLPRADNVSD
jgi:predicted transcriptional regulator